jgi:hypothetical protein
MNLHDFLAGIPPGDAKIHIERQILADPEGFCIMHGIQPTEIELSKLKAGKADVLNTGSMTPQKPTCPISSGI